MQFTEAMTRNLQIAFDHFNRDLFDGALPPPIILMHRHRGAYGYFRPEAFKGRNDTGEIIHELAVNPDTFHGRRDMDILGTFVHEQVHLWQQEEGTPPRKCYHNREWAKKMEEVGLMPSTTGREGGRKTGQKVSHYIIEDGPFERSARALLDTGFTFDFEGNPMPKTHSKSDKVKYSCPDCGQNAWAKPNAELACGRCSQPMNQSAD